MQDNKSAFCHKHTSANILVSHIFSQLQSGVLLPFNRDTHTHEQQVSLSTYQLLAEREGATLPP